MTGAASLHDDDGFLPATAAAAIAQARPEDIHAEGRAQVKQAMAWGVDVTHLDSHMGVVQIDARLFDVYLDLAVEFALPLRMFGARMDTFLGFSGKDRAIARGVMFADHILDPWGRDSRTLLVERLPVLAGRHRDFRSSGGRRTGTTRLRSRPSGRARRRRPVLH